VAIVGPGLDFTDKHDGYDFYPQQTVQPFATIDSLIRLGLAKADRLSLTTLDLSPRINRHLETARQRARLGTAYSLALSRNMDLPWIPSLVTYWERFGATIGEVAKNVAVPPNAGNVRVRAMRVRPSVVMSIVPRDLNIVLQRLEPLPVDDRFDLIIATDVLVYYDIFEQSLALTNVANMLRPGGLFLSNDAVFALPATPMQTVGDTDVIHMTVPGVGELRDRLFWYQRQ
jgi:SAM-dependent methyltransferase